MLQMQNSEVTETCNESAFGLFMRAAVLLWASPYREASLQITGLCATVKPLCSGGSGRVREHISPIQTAHVFQKMVWVWKYENEVNHILWPSASPSSLSWKVVTLGRRLRRRTVQNIIKTLNKGTSFVENSISAAELQTLEKSMLWCTEADLMVSYKNLLCWFIKSTVQPTKCWNEGGREKPLKHLHAMSVQHVRMWPRRIKLEEAIITPSDDSWQCALITTITHNSCQRPIGRLEVTIH